MTNIITSKIFARLRRANPKPPAAKLAVVAMVKKVSKGRICRFCTTEVFKISRAFGALYDKPNIMVLP